MARWAVFFALCWNLCLQVSVQLPVSDCDEIFCDGEEGLELLQKRAKSLVQEALPHVASIGQIVEAAQNETYRDWMKLTGILERLHAVSSVQLRTAASVYALLPSIAAVGLPLLVNHGLIEATAAAAFWLVIRPAAAMVEASWWCLLPGPTVASAHRLSLGLIPEAMVMAAHFYWCWGLLELVGRRRPVAQRLLGVMCLAVVLLPVAFAQVYLEHLQPRQACICALIGDALGLLFFILLRTPPCWRIICALPKEPCRWGKVPTFQLHDNLSTFWGGCVWSAQAAPQRAVTKLQWPSSTLLEGQSIRL